MVRVPRTPPPAKADLERLYHDEGLSSGEVAEALGIARHTVQNWIKKYGIPARTVAEAAALREAKATPEAKEQRRVQLAEAMKKITPEGRKRQGVAISGPREPWTEEVHAKHTYRQTPEYRKRLSELQKGEKAYWWRGGITPEFSAQLNAWEWREARKRCYERDKWTCQDCGCLCVNGAREEPPQEKDPGPSHRRSTRWRLSRSRQSGHPLCGLPSDPRERRAETDVGGDTF